MRAAWLIVALVVLASAGGCNVDLPAVAPRRVPAHATDGPPAQPRSPESIAATLLRAAPEHLLIRADADAAIIDVDALLFVLPASETRATKEALTAALAPLSAEMRAATWNRTAVVLWLGRGDGDRADRAPRLAWDPELRLDLVHDDLTDAGYLVRLVTPSDPRHSRTPRAANRIADRAARTEAKLLEALAHPLPPLPAEQLAVRRAHDWQLLFTSGVWAQRQRALPPAAAMLIVVLLIFFGLSLDRFGSLAELPAETLERNGALIVPAPPGQPARVISYGLLHTGLNHLTNNCIALYIGGFLLEPALGTARTILVFLAGVFAAGVVRRFLRRPGIMAGASGGTFALKGAALALVLLPPAWVPVLERQGFLVMLGIMLALGIILSFLPNISLLGHVAGAGAGALLAVTGVITLARPPLDGGPESALAAGVAWALASVALAAWIGAGLWARAKPPTAPR